MLGIGGGTAGVPGTVSITAIALPSRARLGRRGPSPGCSLVGLTSDSVDPDFGCMVVHGIALLARKRGGGRGGTDPGICSSRGGGAGLLGALGRAGEPEPAAVGNDQPGAIPGRLGDIIGGWLWGSARAGAALLLSSVAALRLFRRVDCGDPGGELERDLGDLRIWGGGSDGRGEWDRITLGDADRDPGSVGVTERSCSDDAGGVGSLPGGFDGKEKFIAFTV